MGEKKEKNKEGRKEGISFVIVSGEYKSRKF